MVAKYELVLVAVPHHARVANASRVLDFQEGGASGGVDHGAGAIEAEGDEEVVLGHQLKRRHLCASEEWGGLQPEERTELQTNGEVGKVPTALRTETTCTGLTPRL